MLMSWDLPILLPVPRSPCYQVFLYPSLSFPLWLSKVHMFFLIIILFLILLLKLSFFLSSPLEEERPQSRKLFWQVLFGSDKQLSLNQPCDTITLTIFSPILSPMDRGLKRFITSLDKFVTIFKRVKNFIGYVLIYGTQKLNFLKCLLINIKFMTNLGIV